MSTSPQSTFTVEQIARCKAAMSKSGPQKALRDLASGRLIVEVDLDRVDDVMVDSFDGKIVRDEDHPDCKMGLAGSWPLYAAGMIDRFGLITAAGHAALAQLGATPLATRDEGMGGDGNG